MRELIVDRIPYTVVNIIHSTDVSSLLCRDSIVGCKGHEVAQQPQPRNSFQGKINLVSSPYYRFRSHCGFKVSMMSVLVPTTSFGIRLTLYAPARIL